MPPSPPHPTARDEAPGGLARVHRLAMELAARIRYAQIVARPVPAEQVEALVAAARLLHDRGEPWPALLGEVLQQVADDLAAQAPAPPEGDGAGTGLSRFFGAFRRERKPGAEA